MEKIYEYLPEEFVTFFLVTLFSLLIGLSQRQIALKSGGGPMPFGTDRTFTFIGISGYLLYLIDPVRLYAFIAGFVCLCALLGINYYIKASAYKHFGLTSVSIAVITYSLAPIVCTQPSWFYITVVVVVLTFTEMKHTFTELVQRMNNDEFVTLAKFLAISGIILPMLPNGRIMEGVSLTPYTIWLTTVIVSGISYLSYLLKRYVFRDSGVFLSGLIGGMYSSTATITVLARKCRKAAAEDMPEYVSAMLAAVGMMNVRFLLLIFIFSRELFMSAYPYLLVSAIVTSGVSWLLHKKWNRKEKGGGMVRADEEKNPLEFKVAIIFAFLFVLFTLLTHFTLKYIGAGGLDFLSFLSGLSDITPFILNLLETGIDDGVVMCCILQAITSNVFVNMCYAYFFSGRRKDLRKGLFAGFGITIVLNLVMSIFIRLV